MASSIGSPTVSTSLIKIILEYQVWGRSVRQELGGERTAEVAQVVFKGMRWCNGSIEHALPKTLMIKQGGFSLPAGLKMGQNGLATNLSVGFREPQNVDLEKWKTLKASYEASIRSICKYGRVILNHTFILVDRAMQEGLEKDKTNIQFSDSIFIEELQEGDRAIAKLRESFIGAYEMEESAQGPLLEGYLPHSNLFLQIQKYILKHNIQVGTRIRCKDPAQMKLYQDDGCKGLLARAWVAPPLNQMSVDECIEISTPAQEDLLQQVQEIFKKHQLSGRLSETNEQRFFQYCHVRPGDSSLRDGRIIFQKMVSSVENLYVVHPSKTVKPSTFQGIGSYEFGHRYIIRGATFLDDYQKIRKDYEICIEFQRTCWSSMVSIVKPIFESFSDLHAAYEHIHQMISTIKIDQLPDPLRSIIFDYCYDMLWLASDPRKKISVNVQVH